MSQSNSNLPAPTGGDFIPYGTDDGRTRIEVRFSGETVWLTLNQMADLFQRDKSVIPKHIKNVFEKGELAPEATVAKFATVQTKGGRGGVRVTASSSAWMRRRMISRRAWCESLGISEMISALLRSA